MAAKIEIFQLVTHVFCLWPRVCALLSRAPSPCRSALVPQRTHARIRGHVSRGCARKRLGRLGATGVQRGDLLVAINGSPVQSPADVVEFQHRSREGTRLAYTLLRLGTREALEVTLVPVPQGSSLYFVLAGVGLFTLVVGALVRLRRPNDQATLHFFWLCIAFFAAF